MKILVTGGAGYIGSVINEELVRQGHQVVALDNLSAGHRSAVVPQVDFIKADLADFAALEKIFRKHRIDSVIHLAALISVKESMAEPLRYFRNNVDYGLNLLECMRRFGINKIIFSSSAAVYGQPEQMPIIESSEVCPINPYGESKLMFEKILKWYAICYGLASISLRFFNVAGASRQFGSAHEQETNLIPKIMNVALRNGEYMPVFGTDYATPDGTCIRDYIHVIDIARAHVLALTYLQTNAVTRVYNLGTGNGFSVMEVIRAARQATGQEIPVRVFPRREGDPAKLIASYRLANADLGWEPSHNLESIVQSAWEWLKEHPRLYSDQPTQELGY